MEEKLYKIQEVAYLHNISKKTLIYYDQIGLFKPQFVDETNNYRYYARKEFPILKQIIYLKKIGFSLDEIRLLLANRTHESIISALTCQKQEIETEISELQQINESIDYMLQFYQKTKYIEDNDLYRPSIKLLPDRKIFYYRCEDSGCKESVMLTYRKVLRHLDSLNLFSHQEYGTIYFNRDENEPICNHVGSFISLPDNFLVENHYLVSGGKYITMYKKSGYYDELGVNYFINWIKENGYEMIGDIYDYCMVDYSFTKNEDEMIMELQVRVR
ncbi:MAG: MerR family transcriptional regulator [Turicibacter sp.]